MKLCYFNGRGLAETSRLLLAIAEQPYTDFRYPLKVIDWSTFNFQKDEFNKDKEDGKLTRSLNKVPFLENGDTVIPQSKAIERYLARKFNMMGSTEEEAALIDAICEWVRDFKTEYQKVRALKGEEREEGMTKWFTDTLPTRLSALDVIVNPKIAVGSQTSLADVVLFSFITQFFDDTERAREACSKAPNILSVVESVESLSSVQKWIRERPETPF